MRINCQKLIICWKLSIACGPVSSCAQSLCNSVAVAALVKFFFYFLLLLYCPFTKATYRVGKCTYDNAERNARAKCPAMNICSIHFCFISAGANWQNAAECHTNTHISKRFKIEHTHKKQIMYLGRDKGMVSIQFRVNCSIDHTQTLHGIAVDLWTVIGCVCVVTMYRFI